MHSFATPPEGEPTASSSTGSTGSPRLERLLECSALLLLELTSAGELIYANPVALSTLGEAVCTAGANFFQHLSLPDAAALSTLGGESTFRIQLEIAAQDALPRCFEFFCTAAKGAEENDERLTLLGRDVTRSRDAEREIHQLHEEIDRLRPKQELGRLAGRIAHDFNNILAAILAYTELARREVRSDHPLQAHLHQVMLAGQRAKKLVRQVLTFSRRQVQRRERLHLVLFVQEVLQLLKPTIPRNVTVRCERTAVSDVVMADSIQIHEVISNLVTNAVNAMEFTGGELVVRLANDEQNRLILSFSDTGHGIDEPTQRRLFEPFFTTRASRGGTGLGLTVVQAIMSDHGGTVSLRSAPQQGATFILSFPQSPV